MIEVPVLEDDIPKRDFIPMLEKEASDFMAELLHLEIPPSPDRLNVPVIETEIKQAVAQQNASYLEIFIRESCFAVDGSTILWKEFYEKFRESVDLAHHQCGLSLRLVKDYLSSFLKVDFMKLEGIGILLTSHGILCLRARILIPHVQSMFYKTAISWS